jgi:exodeoxyribonuclease VII large subunit
MSGVSSHLGCGTGGAEPRRRVWKVSELTRRIKGALEDEFGAVWVEGEISNLRRPASGHAYFTLKDATSQLRAVMFRGALAGVAMPLRDGQLVRGFGQITVYEAGGDVQILLKRIEPAGEGELMLRLEALKKKLAAEGLFDEARKRPLPALPQHVGVVTSPTGAAIRDILQVLDRRFANLHVVLAPARVQGAGAAEEIAAAIDLLNARGGLDVLIVGRGGGSLEDLWCFNEEVVVRAIVRSAIPVISAVGHEIDWTLSDFAADVRAPTPSAAAEMVVKGKDELERRVADARRRLGLGARAAIAGWRHRLGSRGTYAWSARSAADRCAHAAERGFPGGAPAESAGGAAPAGAAADGSGGAEDGIWRCACASTRPAHAQARRSAAADAESAGGAGARLQPDPAGGWHPAAAAGDAPPGTRLETDLAMGTVRSTVDVAEGDPYGDGKKRKGPELREGAGSARGDRGGDGKRRTRTGKDGGGIRGGPETGQALLF